MTKSERNKEQARQTPKPRDFDSSTTFRGLFSGRGKDIASLGDIENEVEYFQKFMELTNEAEQITN